MKFNTPWFHLGWVPVVALVLAGIVSTTPLPQGNGQSGTTLSETVTANAHLTKTFTWGITKTVDPDTLDLFQGDSSTVKYTVGLTKDAGTLHASIDGQVCITNGGSVSTQNLMSKIIVTSPPSTAQLASKQLDVSTHPVLAAGETHCYSYSIDVPQLNAGSTYKVTAMTTITNHSGHLGTPFGPSASASGTMPATPTLVHDSVMVDDSQGGSLGPFSASGTTSYSHTFSCDADNGSNKNTATIIYTDDNKPGPSASATVTVNCYALDVTKTASTSLNRTYTWSIKKSANTSSLALLTGQTANVAYTIDVSTTSADSGWAVAGDITVSNPAPIDATINNVADSLGANSVDCGVTFPYKLPAGQSLDCSYNANLPDGSSGTNTATATLQNHVDGVEQGTTDFTGTATFDFNSAQIHSVDATATLNDTYSGSSLPATLKASDTPATYTYTRQVGPYDSPGSYSVNNTACVSGDDTGNGNCSPVTVTVTVTASGGGGCTLTIGYWKNHPSAIGPLLPIWLGTPNGPKSIQVTVASGSGPTTAVSILSIPQASNGIQKLDAQLLAAKLNIQNGADGSAVATTIALADTFLATHNSGDWASLSKTDQNKVNGWATTLDNYNNGITGPGHCSGT